MIKQNFIFSFVFLSAACLSDFSVRCCSPIFCQFSFCECFFSLPDFLVRFCCSISFLIFCPIVCSFFLSAFLSDHLLVPPLKSPNVGIVVFSCTNRSIAKTCLQIEFKMFPERKLKMLFVFGGKASDWESGSYYRNQKREAKDLEKVWSIAQVQTTQLKCFKLTLQVPTSPKCPEM